ncbi:hypothetical protein HYS94_02100 [Candidatus Daviesbacteria bacterium]|nr:hypothetical protein [Candidatus Daviesbacteria bacterium]
MHYYTVSLVGGEEYSPVIIAILNKIPYFDSVVEAMARGLFAKWLSNPNRTIQGFPGHDHDINIKIAEQLAKEYGGDVIEFEEEYEWEYFTAHSFKYPALAKAQDEPFKENLKPVFPHYFGKDLETKLFNALVEAYKVELEKEKEKKTHEKTGL